MFFIAIENCKATPYVKSGILRLRVKVFKIDEHAIFNVRIYLL